MTALAQLDGNRVSSLSRGTVAGEASRPNAQHASLLCRVRTGVLCAVPLAHVEETMRPLTVVPMAAVPTFIQGISIVRGHPIPVIDVASLLGGAGSPTTRFVIVRTGTRHVALAVEAVLSVIEMRSGSVEELPLLLQGAELDAVSAIGVLDAEVLLVLRTTRLISDDVWATIQAASSAWTA